MDESSGSVVSNSANTHKHLSNVQSVESLKDNTVQKVMELKPIFLDDIRGGEKPETLKNVLSYLQETDPDASQADILVGLIYILMLETGFKPSDAVEDPQEECNFNISVALKRSKQLPMGWKQAGNYKMSFTLPHFESLLCTIVCCCMANDLLVNCVVKGQENGLFSTYLDPFMYFSSSTNNLKNFNLQNVHHFSSKVKEAICYSAKQFILQAHNIKINCLESLPPEVILLLMKHLNTVDFIHLTMTCKHFKQFSEISSIWIERIEDDFDTTLNDRQKELDCEELKQLYKEIIYNKKKYRVIINCKPNWLRGPPPPTFRSRPNRDY